VAVADEPTAALPMFLDVDLVVIVDAVVDGGPPGRVLVLDADALPARGGRLVSTHGVGIADVVGLARLLEPERVAPRLLVVGVTTRVPRLSPDALSPPVHAAVSPAVDAILDALRPPAR
jgi:hydrogenase maturation protease